MYVVTWLATQFPWVPDEDGDLGPDDRQDHSVMFGPFDTAEDAQSFADKLPCTEQHSAYEFGVVYPPDADTDPRPLPGELTFAARRPHNPDRRRTMSEPDSVADHIVKLLAIRAWLVEQTGLPEDFFQLAIRCAVVNEEHYRLRNAISRMDELIARARAKENHE